MKNKLVIILFYVCIGWIGFSLCLVIIKELTGVVVIPNIINAVITSIACVLSCIYVVIFVKTITSTHKENKKKIK